LILTGLLIELPYARTKEREFKDTLSEELFVPDLEVFHFYLLFANIFFFLFVVAFVYNNSMALFFCLEFQVPMEKTKTKPIEMQFFFAEEPG
jgi:hypothetical protein